MEREVMERKEMFLRCVQEGKILKPDPERLVEWADGLWSVNNVTLGGKVVRKATNECEYYFLSPTAFALYLQRYMTNEKADEILTKYERRIQEDRSLPQ